MARRLSMNLSELREYLLPGQAEADEGFRQEILRRARLGLRIVGAAEMAIPLFLLSARVLTGFSMVLEGWRLWQTAWSVGVGLLTLALSYQEWSYAQGRKIAALSGSALAVGLIWTSLLIAGQAGETEHFISRHITLILLLAVACVPFRPLQVLALGGFIEGFFLISTLGAVRWGIIPPHGFDRNDHWYGLALALLATGVVAVLYRQRLQNYQTYLQMLHAIQDLRAAQSQVLRSEHAASLGRLSAALSHEFHSPLGVLKSSIDTLDGLNNREQHTPPRDPARLAALRSQLLATMQKSVERMQSVLARIERFSNLDRADVNSSDLNELVRDVTELMASNNDKQIHFEFDLQTLPTIVCRPQQLSVVFSNLLTNAVNASVPGGRIKVATGFTGTRLKVSIQDFGKGIARADLAHIFDPGFRASGGRIAAGNWSMFSTRQLVRENGGDIQIYSQEGEGTTVTVSLPCDTTSSFRLPHS